MRILLIGGTKFLGRHLVTAAQTRGHEITLFHRGKHSSEGLVGIEEIYGDRNDPLDCLQHRQWDAVIDTCGYLPQTVRASAEALRHAVQQYVFISSISVYTDARPANYPEATPLATLTAEQAGQAQHLNAKADLTARDLGALYGALKASCEQQVQQVFGEHSLLVRPGVLVGPHDPTDRFTYWAQRVARGGEVLAPGRPGRFVQFIDVRDVADWIVGMVESKAGGIYNVNGKPFALTFAQMLESMKVTSQSTAAFTWVDERFLQQQQLQEWSELPLYLAESRPENAGFMSANIDRALAQGLTFRPLQETIQDTLAWQAMQPAPLQAGLDPGREREVLAHYAGAI